MLLETIELCEEEDELLTVEHASIRATAFPPTSVNQIFSSGPSAMP